MLPLNFKGLLIGTLKTHSFFTPSTIPLKTGPNINGRQSMTLPEVQSRDVAFRMVSGSVI